MLACTTPIRCPQAVESGNSLTHSFAPDRTETLRSLVPHAL